MSTLEDIINCPNRRLNSKGAFLVARHDGTYKTLMSLSEHPKNGDKIRRSERWYSLGATRKRPETPRLHVAHTLVPASGAAIASSAEYSESRARRIFHKA